ncbi:MAG: DUF6132 family protein [Fermentimonas sp.]|jgi:xanthine/uracil permease
MKQFLYKHWLKIAGVLIGVLAGYLYYYQIGCVTGTCPITSNPYRMMLYGALIGYLFFDMFTPEEKKVEGSSNIINETNKNEEQ